MYYDEDDMVDWCDFDLLVDSNEPPEYPEDRQFYDQLEAEFRLVELIQRYNV